MRIHVTEIAVGYWLASIEGEESDSVIDRSPDQALASLVRVNLRRLGTESIVYRADSPLPDGSSIPFGAAHSPVIRRPESSG
jgi:hypothetical protein